VSEGSLSVRPVDFLDRPIGELIVPEVQVRVAPEVVRDWHLPAADLSALTTWGLPTFDDGSLVPDPHPGPHDQRYRGDQAYRLGTEWGAVVGAVAGSGRVVRFGVTDPEPMLINSSLAAFVESAWRYLWVSLQEGGHYDDETDDVLDAFLARLQRIDPAIGSDPHTSYWPSVVEYW
jgi:SUKH-4 immunity protein